VRGRARCAANVHFSPTADVTLNVQSDEGRTGDPRDTEDLEMTGHLKNELSPPPMANKTNATEVLRVWAAPGAPQQLVLRPTWKDPAAWGLMLVDIARHAAKAYAAEGASEAEVLDRILQSFRAEVEAPTDTPSQIS
jgi:hypothetical protein